jgi:tetratricopeptide (TPR) repeat protein
VLKWIPYVAGDVHRLNFNSGDMKQAGDIYNQALRVKADFVYAQAGVARVRAAQGRYDEAISLYSSAIEQLYISAGVDVDMELALFEADHGGDPAKVVAQARTAFAHRPTVYAADTLAWALYQAGSAAEAHGFSEQALRVGSQDAAVPKTQSLSELQMQPVAMTLAER